MDDKLIAAFKGRYLAGESAAAIGAAYGFSGETVRRWLRPLGIMRDRSAVLRAYSQHYFYWAEAFDIQNATPEMAYWAGWLCADGTIYKNSIRIEISTRDEVILKGLRRYVCTAAPLSQRTRNGDQCMSRLVLSSAALVAAVRAWGVVPRKSHAGSDLSKVPRDLYPLFFRGLFEGDGCVHMRPNGVLFVSLAGRPEVIDRFRCWTWDTDRNPGSLNRRSARTHVVSFGGKSAQAALALIYDGTSRRLRLKRKARYV